MADTKTSALATINGADTATGDKLLWLDISDTTQGAGGTLKAITKAELIVALGGGQSAHVSDQKSAGTDGGTFTAGAWQTRDLNTVDHNDDSLISLASNQITFNVAGRYKIEAWGMTFNVVNHTMRFYDISNSSSEIISDTNYARSGTAGDSNKAHLIGVIDIAADTIFELQHRCESTQSGNGFGEGSDQLWQVCKYADVFITKVS